MEIYGFTVGIPCTVVSHLILFSSHHIVWDTALGEQASREPKKQLFGIMTSKCQFNVTLMSTIGSFMHGRGQGILRSRGPYCI
jgi:hypothetical protein